MAPDKAWALTLLDAIVAMHGAICVALACGCRGIFIVVYMGGKYRTPRVAMLMLLSHVELLC